MVYHNIPGKAALENPCVTSDQTHTYTLSLAAGFELGLAAELAHTFQVNALFVFSPHFLGNKHRWKMLLSRFNQAHTHSLSLAYLAALGSGFPGCHYLLRHCQPPHWYLFLSLSCPLFIFSF